MSVRDDLPDVEYHQHPALSPSGAKQLLKCPARYHWQRTNPPAPKPQFDIGHVVHEMVLGIGAGVAVIDGSRNAKDVKEKIEQARAEGKAVLKSEQYDECRVIADAVTSDPVAGAIFSHGQGRAELSMFWRDEPTGADLRGRLDWLHPTAVVDLKTAAEGGADPDRIARTAWDLGYFLSAAAYDEGALATSLIDTPLPQLLVVVEKAEPYPVSVVQFSDYYLDLGREKWRQAIDLFHECTETGQWPTYTSDIPTIEPPRWAS